MPGIVDEKALRVVKSDLQEEIEVEDLPFKRPLVVDSPGGEVEGISGAVGSVTFILSIGGLSTIIVCVYLYIDYGNINSKN